MRILIFLISISLFSCAQKVKIPVQSVGQMTLINHTCSKSEFKRIQIDMQTAAAQVVDCFSRHDRNFDAENYKKIIDKNDIQIKCVPTDTKYPDRSLALAHWKSQDPLAPGISLQMEQMSDSGANDVNGLMSTLFHESIHWLGYEHYKDIDITYIASMCCLDQDKEYLKKAGKKACDLFRFKKTEDRFSPEYISDFSEAISDFGRSRIAVQTAVRFALQAVENNFSQEQVYRIIYAPLPAINSELKLLNRLTKKDKEAFADYSESTAGLILSSVAKKTTETKIKKAASQHYSQLATNYFDGLKSKKITFFTQLGEAFDAALLNDPDRLRTAWKQVTTLAPAVCPTLSANAISGIDQAVWMLGGRVWDIIEAMQSRYIVDSQDHRFNRDIRYLWADPCQTYRKALANDSH